MRTIILVILLLSIIATTSSDLSASTTVSTFEGSATADPFCAPGFCEGSPGLLRGPLDLTISVPTFALGDGIFKFTAYGDFNLDSEFIVLEAEGFAFGTFLNTNPDDDIFDDDGWRPGWEDRGNEYGLPRVALSGNVCNIDGCVYQPPRTGVALIPQADLQRLVADAFFTVSIWLGGNVSNGPIISFDTLAPVPGPPGLALLGGALAAFGLARRKRG
jgi:hypothetical protein